MLLYAQDSASWKRPVAADLIIDVQRQRNGVISTQVLQELYHNLTGKFRTSPADAAELVRELRQLEVVVITENIIDDAMRLHAGRQTSFWDSLIVCAAASAKCRILYTEDMPDGETMLGVRIENPFRKS